MSIASIVLAALAGTWILAYHCANGVAWTVGLVALSAAVTFATGAPPWLYGFFWAVTAVFGVFAIVKPLRAGVVTKPIFGIYKKILPQVSQTEQEALDAGSIWWDADLFSGRPDWKKMMAYPEARLRVLDHLLPVGPAAEEIGIPPDAAGVERFLFRLRHLRQDLLVDAEDRLGDDRGAEASEDREQPEGADRDPECHDQPDRRAGPDVDGSDQRREAERPGEPVGAVVGQHPCHHDGHEDDRKDGCHCGSP